MGLTLNMESSPGKECFPMKFNEMTYTRPDIDALLARCRELAAKAAAAPEGVNPTTFTSGRDASRLACTQVHAAAGCRPCTAGTPSSTAQLPVDAALNAHGLTLLMVLL